MLRVTGYAAGDGMRQRARRAMPGRMEELVRRDVQLLGQVTAPARLLPAFLIVGAQRAGTTTLYRLLCEHPDVVRPALTKGIGYFDMHYDRPWSWYRGHFPLAAVARSRVDSAGSPLTFESSGYYMYHPLAAERIAARLPDVRVVALVRDPVERAYSAHAHELRRGFETEPFERAVELEPERLRGEEERMVSDPSYQSFSHRHHSYLTRGRYAYQIERLRGALGPGKVLVIDANRFFADPYEEFARLTDWLGMRTWRPASVGKLNAAPREPMSASLRTRLLERFDAADAALTPLLGAEPSWRR